MNGESKLKVLRAVAALRKFTAGEIMGWTGMTSGQVIPQIARLMNDDRFIEYDTDHGVESNAPRPAHRPVRHYRLTNEATNRRKMFAEIRAARAALGEDPVAQRLALIQGRLEEIGELLKGFQSKNIAISRDAYAEYQARLERNETVLNEAILETEVEDEALHGRIKKLRELHGDLGTQLSALFSAPHDSTRLHETRVRQMLTYLFQQARAKGILPEPEALATELKAPAAELREVAEVLRHHAPTYSSEARIDYAVSKVAAEVVSDPDILLTVTERLLDVAPEPDRHFYEYNRANLLAWAGRDAAAYEQWSQALKELGGKDQPPFSITVGGLIDNQEVDEASWAEVEAAARLSGGIVAIASRTPVPTIACPFAPVAALSDPFHGTIELGNAAADAKYVVYGPSFRDLFRSQPGVSYSRLATTLCRVGVGPKQAWNASRQVKAGKVLVVYGHLSGSMSSSSAAHMQSLLEKKLGAHRIELGLMQGAVELKAI